MWNDVLIFVLGGIFGYLIQLSKMNKFDVITGQAKLEDNTILKALLLAIGVGMLLLSVIIDLGWASFHIKPLLLGGVIIGGILFGIGMAILGYCPGTMAISLGEGALDAFVGILGGLTSGYLFTILYPKMKTIIGPNLGKVYLFSLTSEHKLIYFLIVLITGLILIYLSFKIKNPAGNSKNWIITGLGLAVLNAIIFMKGVGNRPIGASTTYPYLADVIMHATNNEYFAKIKKPGNWEAIFLLGALVVAFVNSLIRKDFKVKLIFSNWEKSRGKSTFGRIIWAFVGGFVLIFGARMAGGCTSGHILSGGMQFSISSWLFAIVVFTSLIITGKLFYKK